MADKKVESGFPVDGEVNEKLAYLTKQIAPSVMFSSDREIDSTPVWSLMSDGSFAINGALVRSVPKPGCFRAGVKSLLARLHKHLSRAHL